MAKLNERAENPRALLSQRVFPVGLSDGDLSICDFVAGEAGRTTRMRGSRAEILYIDMLDSKAQDFSFVKTIDERSVIPGRLVKARLHFAYSQKGHVRRGGFAGCHMKKSTMRSDRPVDMANQIVGLFDMQDKTNAFETIAEHLSKLLNPTVRAQTCAYFAGGMNDFDLFIRQAVRAAYCSARGALQYRD